MTSCAPWPRGRTLQITIPRNRSRRTLRNKAFPDRSRPGDRPGDGDPREPRPFDLVHLVRAVAERGAAVVAVFVSGGDIRGRGRGRAESAGFGAELVPSTCGQWPTSRLARVNVQACELADDFLETDPGEAPESATGAQGPGRAGIRGPLGDDGPAGAGAHAAARADRFHARDCNGSPTLAPVPTRKEGAPDRDSLGGQESTDARRPRRAAAWSSAIRRFIPCRDGARKISGRWPNRAVPSRPRHDAPGGLEPLPALPGARHGTEPAIRPGGRDQVEVDHAPIARGAPAGALQCRCGGEVGDDAGARGAVGIRPAAAAR